MASRRQEEEEDRLRREQGRERARKALQKEKVNLHQIPLSAHALII